jgi:SAM-dependent methyltransferase
MPDLTWNKGYWDGDYDWDEAGEEWSSNWGSSEAQWFGSLYPRIHRFLPAQNILEIAPGFGRWTRYLLQYTSGKYDGVDLSVECTQHCQRIFKGVSNATFSVNDGTDLSQFKDDSYDFVFSFDSLVHAELDVHEQYIPQILAKLKEGGVAFIHHSNWASSDETKDNTHCRGESVSAEAYADIVVKSGGRMILQECLNWGTTAQIDAFTLFGKSNGEAQEPFPTVSNPDFMAEANIIREVQNHYSKLKR